MDATGFWTGSYWYFTPFQPVVQFFANIDDDCGRLTGSISELDCDSDIPVRLEAIVLGDREDNKVKFAKVYDGSGPFAHRVDYSGTISEDGSSMTGGWSLPGERGGFKMTRELLADDEEGIEQVCVDLDLEATPQ